MNSWTQKFCLIVLLAGSCIGQQIKCMSDHPIKYIIKWGDPRMPKGYKLELLSEILPAIDIGHVLNPNERNYEECLYEDLVYVVSEIFSQTLNLDTNPMSITNEDSGFFETDLLRNVKGKLNEKANALGSEFEKELAEAQSMSAKHYKCQCTENNNNNTCRCKHLDPYAIQKLRGSFKTLKHKKATDKYNSNKPNYG